MRLIDADALLKELESSELQPNKDTEKFIDGWCEGFNTVVDMIRNQPTAYNPKKVVEELEEYKYSHLVEHDSERYEHCKEEEINCDGRDCFLCVWDKAIEIVRKGGV